jgi:hypothetical protein
LSDKCLLRTGYNPWAAWVATVLVPSRSPYNSRRLRRTVCFGCGGHSGWSFSQLRPYSPSRQPSFEVSATDPWTFVAVAMLVVMVGLAACPLPAPRATRVDPLVALRYESRLQTWLFLFARTSRKSCRSIIPVVVKSWTSVWSKRSPSARDSRYLLLVARKFQPSRRLQ